MRWRWIQHTCSFYVYFPFVMEHSPFASFENCVYTYRKPLHACHANFWWDRAHWTWTRPCTQIIGQKRRKKRKWAKQKQQNEKCILKSTQKYWCKQNYSLVDSQWHRRSMQRSRIAWFGILLEINAILKFMQTKLLFLCVDQFRNLGIDIRLQ